MVLTKHVTFRCWKIHAIFRVYLKILKQTWWNCAYGELLQIKNILNTQSGLDKVNYILYYSKIQRIIPQNAHLVNKYNNVNYH